MSIGTETKSMAIFDLKFHLLSSPFPPIDSLCSPCGQTSFVVLRYAPGLLILLILPVTP